MAKRQEHVPRAFPVARAPRYPRTLGIGTMLLLGACCKSTPNESTSDPADTVDPTMLPGGAPPPVYTEASTEAGPPESVDAAAHASDAAPAAKKSSPRPIPMPPGTAPPPFSSR